MESRPTDPEATIPYEFGQILGEALDLDRALEKYLNVLAASTSMTKGVIILMESGFPVVRASYGLLPGETASPAAFLGEQGLTSIRAARQGFALSSAGRKLFPLEKIPSGVGKKARIALAGAPILANQDFLGVLLVDRVSTVHPPLAEEVQILERLASLVAGLVDLHRRMKSREEKWRWENLSLKARLAQGHQHLLVGESPAMQALKHTIVKVAESRAPVVLIGEAGTGKTLIARLIHELSPRAGRPFVKVNCASLSAELLEAEFFGVERGASAGPGRLEEADGGTLFLAEVDRLSQVLQAKILRFLEEHRFRRLGGAHSRRADVRLIGAAGRSLEAAVKEGRFLEELLNKLGTFSLDIPPLRERREDVLPLLNYFLDHVSREHGRRFYLTQEAQEILCSYDWPGNGREMEQLVERLAVMAEGVALDVQDLPPQIHRRRKKTEAAQPVTMSRLKELEKREIVAALERHHWVQSQAAMELGLTLRQMGYRVKQFGLEKVAKERRSRAAGTRSKQSNDKFDC